MPPHRGLIVPSHIVTGRAGWRRDDGTQTHKQKCQQSPAWMRLGTVNQGPETIPTQPLGAIYSEGGMTTHPEQSKRACEPTVPGVKQRQMGDSLSVLGQQMWLCQARGVCVCLYLRGESTDRGSSAVGGGEVSCSPAACGVHRTFFHDGQRNLERGNRATEESELTSTKQ